MPIAPLDDGQIEYFVEGEGPPLLLLHGSGTGASLWFSHGYVAALKPHFRVIAPNNRGYGRSSPITHPDQLRFGLFRDDVHAVLDHAAADRAVVMGYSRGGVLAMMLAMEYPERVARLVVGAANLAPSARYRAVSGHSGWLADPGRLLSPREVAEALGRRVRRYLLGPPPREPSIWDGILDRFGMPPDEVWRRYIAPFADTDRAAERLTMPALFFQGDRDLAYDLMATKEFVRHLERGELRVVKRATHGLIQDADRVLALVTPFLCGADAPADSRKPGTDAKEHEWNASTSSTSSATEPRSQTK